MGVVTGIPMEFQFGTNWSRFSRIAGGVIGQTLAMEGVFAFFLESSVLYLVLFQEQKLGPRRHLLATIALCLGSWLSGFFIVCTNAFMQHPQGFVLDQHGIIHLTSFAQLLLNPWAWLQYCHTMIGATITGSFTVAATGAFYILQGRDLPVAKKMLSAAVVVGTIAALAAAFPSGDQQAKAVLRYQPETFAAMEGHFHTEVGAGMTLVGQPNVEQLRIDNPIRIPLMLSFLTHQRWDSEIKGLTEFPRERWPDNIPLLYYAYHVIGRPGLAVHRPLQPGEPAALARHVVSASLRALAADADVSVAVRGQHDGLAHRRIGPTTLAGARHFAHERRLVRARELGQHALFAARLHGLVRHAVLAVLLFGHAPLAGWPHGKGERVMAELWFWLLAGMLAVYAVLDGFDFGVGMLHFVLAKTPAERDTLLRSIGPVWDGNEVWLVAAGGTLFGAFPALYATAFSGFYLPLMIVLWLLLFRALGIELRHQVDSPLWQQLWDVAFSGASLLLALFFGAALGNLVRGLPLNENGDFFEPLWTDFRVGDVTGILDWYTLLVGVTATAALALHGALWVSLKTTAELGERAARYASSLWPGVALLVVCTTLASVAVQPRLLENLGHFPVGAVLPLLAVASLVGVRVLMRRAPGPAFLASCGFIFGLILSAAFAIFPNALTARKAGRELTVAAAAADSSTLGSMLCWWLPGLLLAVSYSYFIYARMPKKFTPGGAEH